MLFTNKTMRIIACFRRNAKVQTFWLACYNLWVFLKFFFFFFFVGITRHVSDAKKKKSACSQSLIASSGVYVVIVPTKICYLPTKQWEESCFRGKSTKISARSLRSRAMIYGFFASFWFSGLYKSSWTRHITSVTNTNTRTCTDKLCDSPTKYWEECKNTQNSARSQSSIAFSRVSGFLVGMKNTFSTQKYKNFGSLAVISGYISRFWFSGRHNEQDHITSVTNTRT